MRKVKSVRSCRYALLLLACLACPFVAHAAVFDHDGDGDVDWVDYQDFATCLSGPDGAASPPCVDVHDGDGDSDVDLADFGLF